VPYDHADSFLRPLLVQKTHLAVSSKFNTSKFSAIRSDRTDFGIAERSFLQVPADHHLGRGLAIRSCPHQLEVPRSWIRSSDE